MLLFEMPKLSRLSSTQLIAAAFTALILLGTFLLMLPAASKAGTVTNFFDALFTSTSAVTVTGLTTLDSETHWSTTGHIILAFLIQIGGFGIIGFATLVGFLIEGRVSLKNRISATSESSATKQPDIRTLLKNIAKLMLFFQLVLFLFLTIRFFAEYGYSFEKALAHGGFHAISAFNQAGFTLYTDSLMGFANDGWIIAPIFLISTLAGFGFPVMAELRDRFKLMVYKLIGKAADYSMPAQWSLNSRIILWASLFLLIVGTIGIAISEWNNPRTLGALEPIQKMMASMFTSSMPRSTGLNIVDTGSMYTSTWLGIDILMFIGGASASTAGGIKIGTAVVLLYIVYTEIRGDAAVNVGNRRLPRSMQRQALTIATLYIFVVIGAIFLLRFTTEFSLDELLFEVISAAGTVGLTTGITPYLPDHAKFLLSLLMLFGRLGPIVVATSLALRKTKRHFELPKERPLIG
jgi:Trk-type K+ transport system membrane component